MKITLSHKKKLHFASYSKYIDYVLNHMTNKQNFVPISDEMYSFDKIHKRIKPIAFYLPQYHDFEENIKWFGRGFSEWSNCAKTMPQYIGHNQPHIPIDVGFYNLETTITYKRQIELAKKYGIYGFSFYYYWFSGKKIMEKPIENMLNDKSLDFPFFIFWANEDWTRLWNGGKSNLKEVLYKQEIKDGDAELFMQDVLPFMKDNRYIKVKNSPLLIIYDPHIYEFEKYINFISRIRTIAKDNGFDDLYILTTTLRLDKSGLDCKSFIEKYNLDGIFEFFPQGISNSNINLKFEEIANKQFKGSCFDVEEYVNSKKFMMTANENIFKGCFPNWDNTARKCYQNAKIFQSSPSIYRKWFESIVDWTIKNKKEDEAFVFINAWNEWAEGAHLEPDQTLGYAYLQSTKDALMEVEV